MYTLKRFSFILLIFAIVFSIFACVPPEAIEDPLEARIFEDDNLMMVEFEPMVSEDGFIYIIIPENLLLGKNAEAAVEDWNNPEPEHEDDLDTVITKVYENADGSVTYVFTPEQHENFRSSMFKYGHMHNTMPNSSIIHTFYHDNMIREVTVYVDQERYKLFDNVAANAMLAGYAGTYQVLSGVPADEWHTTITVLDAESDEVISITEFPNPDMYKV